MTEIKNKSDIFQEIEKEIKSKNLSIDKIDQSRPWGGFFVIDESQSQEFANTYFDGLDVQELKISGKLSPKVLIVSPQKRLSWQYHHRRSEIWRVIRGQVSIITSDSDEENDPKVYNVGDIIRLNQGQRHRAVGLNDYGVIAEIWQHTDAENPSDEDDIVRVQDDFGR